MERRLFPLARYEWKLLTTISCAPLSTIIRCCKKHTVASSNNSKYVPVSPLPTVQDVNLLTEFINDSKRLFVLTGAGISTESGIRDYRSEGVGQYAVSDQRPTQYIDFLKKPNIRKRYWARNFAAWPLFRAFQPNINHYILAEMEKHGNLYWLVTQNVDSLHFKAGSTKVSELHGTTAKVGCLECCYEISRDELQKQLLKVNTWNIKNIGTQAPDADVTVPEHEADKFQMIDCPSCGGILKPKVVFFGDNVSSILKDFIHDKLITSDRMLVLGSSLKVYSSFRYINAARENKIPIAILNIGETRGDRYADLKLNFKAGDILTRVRFPWKSNEQN